jgi:hypothetical protein
MESNGILMESNEILMGFQWNLMGHVHPLSISMLNFQRVMMSHEI